MKKLLCLLLFLAQFSVNASAQESFVVKNIEVVGLHRTSAATVESYLPVKRGQKLRATQTAKILRALYKTKFFDQISLSRQGNTLIIHVVERPTIGQLKISGNSIIPTDKLTKVMNTLGIAEGRIYNPEILDKIKQSLLNQYFQLGRYNARVDVTVTPMSRNRVRVNIAISEGLVAKIQRISIIGNHAFDEATLVKQLNISTSGLFTFFTQSDRYSEVRLEENAERLRAFYLDHGYLHVQIKSAQAQVTPDRKSVYITFVIDEGLPYYIKDFDIEGDLVVPKEELLKQVSIKAGDVFSRQKIIDSEKAITNYLGQQGYLLTTISLRPRINEKRREVILVFVLSPGKRMYVRHVGFSNNMRTNDNVLRREVQQMEAAPASTVKLEESKHRLSLLPFIRQVDMSIKPVENIEDQVDVNYKVEEDTSAQVSAKIGYAQSYGFLVGVGANLKNFMGTGNTLGVNLNRSRFAQFYGIDYTDPYYTEDGISRSINFSISTMDPGAVAKVNNGYSTNEYNFGVLYGIPIGQETNVFSRIYAGISYQNTLVNLSRKQASNQVNAFVNAHGRRFVEADLKLGYTRDSRDKAIFPTRGSLHTTFADVFLPLSGSSLSFYTLNYNMRWYQPIYNDFILLTRTDLGYGNAFHGPRNFPFFKNYYAGGIDSVRGYLTYNLGPRDSNYQAYGGNMLVDGSIGLIFPNHISDNLRTSVFIDGGNVYSSLNNRNFGGQSTNSGPLRFSAGIEADWLTPFGPIRISVAVPINRQPHDKIGAFEFALGNLL